MNILYIADMLTILGGCEMHVITLAKEMSKTNKVYILTNHLNEVLQKQLDGIEVLVVFNEKNYKILDKKNIDVIHANPFTGIGLGHELSKRFKADLFITMHGNYSTGLTTDIVRDCEKVIFVSETAKKACSGLVPEEKSVLINNPIDTSKFKFKPMMNVKRIKSLINKEFKTIVVSSRIDDDKEIPMFQLLEILTDLVKNVGGLNILFVGGGTKLPALMEQANKIKSDLLNIKFVGEVDDVYNYLNIADLVLGCDRCAIEAILCKKIVFYMGQTKWKGLIQNANYYESLFTLDGYVDYANGELLNHLTWMLNQTETVKAHTNEIFDLVKGLCDSSVIKEKIEDLYKR